MPKGGRRMNLWLSKEEDERLESICQKTGKKKSVILKESLYEESTVKDAEYADAIFKIGLCLAKNQCEKAKKEVKKYADSQIRKRNK